MMTLYMLNEVQRDEVLEFLRAAAKCSGPALRGCVAGFCEGYDFTQYPGGGYDIELPGKVGKIVRSIMGW